MGDSTTNCMVSGLPIPPGTETVVLFTTPSRSGSGEQFKGGVYPWDMFQFISWPIRITMDDYQGFGDYFGSDPEKIEDLEKQLSWRIFKTQMVTARNEKVSYTKDGKPDPTDWGRNLMWRQSGLWQHPLLGFMARARQDEETNWDEVFDSGIIPCAFTYVHGAVWDWCVSQTSLDDSREFEKRLSTKIRLPDPKTLSKEEDMKLFNEVMRDLGWGQDIWHHSQLNLIKTGEDGENFRTEPLWEIKLSDDEWQELKDMSLEMFRFVHGAWEVGGWIHPNMSLAPQMDYCNDHCRKAYRGWAEFLQQTVEHDIKARRGDDWDEDED